ncbi:MAG: DUF2125 domain-containing protein [Alphaproteobacteria bacterium]|nr:DUF2125 domain-containing protein [Alphaproteobacteria bacterium]
MIRMKRFLMYMRVIVLSTLFFAFVWTFIWFFSISFFSGKAGKKLALLQNEREHYLQLTGCDDLEKSGFPFYFALTCRKPSFFFEKGKTRFLLTFEAIRLRSFPSAPFSLRFIDLTGPARILRLEDPEETLFRIRWRRAHAELSGWSSFPVLQTRIDGFEIRQPVTIAEKEEFAGLVRFRRSEFSFSPLKGKRFAYSGSFLFLDPWFGEWISEVDFLSWFEGNDYKRSLIGPVKSKLFERISFDAVLRSTASPSDQREVFSGPKTCCEPSFWKDWGLRIEKIDAVFEPHMNWILLLKSDLSLTLPEGLSGDMTVSVTKNWLQHLSGWPPFGWEGVLSAGNFASPGALTFLGIQQVEVEGHPGLEVVLSVREGAVSLGPLILFEMPGLFSGGGIEKEISADGT